VRYLNLHAPGRQFANYMRALRDGQPPPDTYDQHPPPPDGGRPTSGAVVGGHEPLGDEPGLRVTLLADIEALRVTEVRCDPGVGSTTQAHADHLQCLYVLDGEMTLTIGDRRVRAGPGTWLGLAPGIPHAVSCPGPAPVRLLDLRAPAR
jgi:quercetin dioxygenase-like cupin family protein